jgi:hypothetical protein
MTLNIRRKMWHGKENSYTQTTVKPADSSTKVSLFP